MLLKCEIRTISFSNIDVHICYLFVANPKKSINIGYDYMHLFLWGVPLAEWLLGTKYRQCICCSIIT